MIDCSDGRAFFAAASLMHNAINMHTYTQDEKCYKQCCLFSYWNGKYQNCAWAFLMYLHRFARNETAASISFRTSVVFAAATLIQIPSNCQLIHTERRTMKKTHTHKNDVSNDLTLLFFFYEYEIY